MSHLKLQYSARQLLSLAPKLDNPILFTFENQWILSFSPVQTRCIQDKQALAALIGSNRTPYSGHNSPSGHFSSGWAGYLRYPDQPDTNNTLSGWFGDYPASLLIDRADDSVWLQNPRQLTPSDLQHWLQPIRQLTAANSHNNPSARERHWQPGWSQTQYHQAFSRVQHYLTAGDCYQVNLTMPFYCQDDLTEQSPLSLLQAFEPRFGGYLKSPGGALFSVSPERFIRIDGQRIETCPIKGTLPRGNTPQQDQQLAQQLKDSAKNQAENLMIVDLLRNDLSIHAEPHSVKVEKLFELESHANVHHLVSTITARRKVGDCAGDVISDAFPGGSITGAPKKRAMEVISELEAQPRGAYCGSLGYFDDAGYADFNILIRTIEATQQGAFCWGGGGITVASTADDEYQEILAKVGKILATPL